LSKERAKRRAARQAEIAARAAARERRSAAQARRARWWDKLTGWLPHRHSPAPGLLAAKRRRTWGLVLFAFLVVQALTWLATPDWGLRVAVLLVSLFAVPVVAALAS
jgi:Flp pilus assembly protein TadB